jgi:hypothetical protein
MIYFALKTLAEREVGIHRCAQGRVAWDLVVINPPWVFGVRRRFLPSRPMVLNLVASHSRISAPRRRSTTLIHLSGRSTTCSWVHGPARVQTPVVPLGPRCLEPCPSFGQIKYLIAIASPALCPNGMFYLFPPPPPLLTYNTETPYLASPR